MISSATQAFVWIWLPERSSPVVAGRLALHRGKYHFVYGRSYLDNKNAIALSPFELELQMNTFEPQGINEIHSCLRDAAPDAWGRRVVSYKYPSLSPNELDYMLLSGSNRIGALDFQQSNTDYEPRNQSSIQLSDLMQAASFLEQQKPLPSELDKALLHGTSVGGARPKALIIDKQCQYVAKFSSSTDHYDVVKAEFIAMSLAKKAGINVANVQLLQELGKDILLVERFDRRNRNSKVYRKLLLSGLSLLQLNEMEARYASYHDLAEIIRHRFVQPKACLIELYKRIVFNILIGNTDDHARNHAAFWNGKQLSLTPAYDICPQNRTGQEATQAMDLGGRQKNHATLVNVLSICHHHLLKENEAREIIQQIMDTIHQHWKVVCDKAELSENERKRLWQGAVMNPYCFTDWE